MPTAIEDRDEILQLLYRYNISIDSGDADGYADTFLPDGTFDVGGHVMAGRDELVTFAQSVKGLRHVVANPLVDLSGDVARVRAYVIVYSDMALRMIGTYDDEVVRTPDGWRFAKRRFTPDAPLQER